MIKRLAGAVLIYVIGETIIIGICAAAKNLMDGKDILGRKKVKPPKQVDINWHGDIVLGKNDFVIE